MTITANTMEWLNQNRNRAYPFVREEWRSLDIVHEYPWLDCVLLDALVFDADARGDEDLVLERIEVSGDTTNVCFKYGDTTFSELVTGGDDDGENSIIFKNRIIEGHGCVGVSVSLAFSSHSHMRMVGCVDGSFNVGCRIMPTRVVRMSDGEGVRYLHTNGSKKVDGHDAASDITGEVILEDGFRTSPVIAYGKIQVRVGKRYGYDPCHYDFGDEYKRDCRKPLLFFCGQNAINSGNIVIKGGAGVSVRQGGTYTVEDENSKCNGMTIPCIEIIAGKEIMEIGRIEK